MSVTNLDTWMSRADWLRAAARVRADEAMAHPEHSEERRKQSEIAADLERRAAAAGMVA